MVASLAAGRFDCSVRPIPYILEVHDLHKSFGGVHALQGVDFRISPGEVVGLVGHNGAGKSTLMNILAGTIQRSRGEFTFAEARVGTWNPHQAQAHGLRCVFQELSLCGNLTLAENTRIIHPALRGPGWRRRASRLIDDTLGMIFPDNELRPDMQLADLPVGARQMVEIARAFTTTDVPVRCVILDEPTSALGYEPTQQLLAHVRRAASSGISCIFITHRLDEIMDVSDRVVVMVDGGVVAERPTAGLTRPQLVGLMGSIEVPREHRGQDRGSLKAEPPVIDYPGGEAGDLPIRVAPGEIVGFAGLDGHGQRERLRALFFAARRRAAHGLAPPVAYVAGDRGTEGIFALWSIAENVTICSLKGLRRAGLISPLGERGLAQRWSDRLSVKAPSVSTPILELSGGNQQKVLFARALASDAGIVLLDDPMRGVDVATKQEVYGLIRSEAGRGRSFVWYTTEVEELTNCDRLYVFREGRAAVELRGEEVVPARILDASFGGHSD